MGVGGAPAGHALPGAGGEANTWLTASDDTDTSEDESTDETEEALEMEGAVGPLMNFTM